MLSDLPVIALAISRSGVVVDASSLLLDLNGSDAGSVIGLPSHWLFSHHSSSILDNYLGLTTLDRVTANEELEMTLGGEPVAVNARLAGTQRDGEPTLQVFAVEAVSGRQLHAQSEGAAELLRGYIETTSQPMWCIEFTEPVNLRETESEVIRQIFSNECHWSNCNEAMSRFYSLPEGVDINDQPVRTYFPRSPQNEAFVRNLIRNNFNVDRSLAVDLKYDGSAMYVENNVRGKIQDGSLIRMWGTLQDLTDFRNERDKLVQTAELVQGILNAIPDAVLVANRAGIITAVNPACEQLFNAISSSILAKQVTDFLAMTDAEVQRRWANGEDHRWADAVKFASGDVLDCDVRVGPVGEDPFSKFVFSIRPLGPEIRKPSRPRPGSAASKRSADEVR